MRMIKRNKSIDVYLSLIFYHNVNLNSVVFLEPLFKVTKRVGSMV